MKNATINVGDTIKFQTQAEGNPKPTVSWYKDDKPLEFSQKIKEFYENDIWTLIILEAEPEDSGCYEAVAENAHGKVFTRGNLTVIGDREKKEEPQPIEEDKSKPKLYSTLFNQPFVERPIKDQTVREGTSVTFECKINHSERNFSSSKTFLLKYFIFLFTLFYRSNC